MIGGVAALGAALLLAVPGVVAASDGRSGYVYTETNAATGNAILAYSQGHDGSLTAIGTFPTGGLGTGSGLATQGEVILAGGGKWLLAADVHDQVVDDFARGGSLRPVTGESRLPVATAGSNRGEHRRIRGPGIGRFPRETAIRDRPRTPQPRLENRWTRVP
jgi:hypothetical protein